MKILLVADGYHYSRMAAQTLGAHQLASQTEVTVMTMVPDVCEAWLDLHPSPDSRIDVLKTKLLAERGKPAPIPELCP